MPLTITNARILTLAQPGPAEARRRAAMRDLGVIERGHVRIDEGEIVAVGAGDPQGASEGEVIDAGGSVLMPAFVDCHTHCCWAGDRFDEFEMSLAGASYLKILKSGGGIMSTVRSVRAAGEEDLLNLLLRRLAAMAALGTGTVEIKSGYGLNPEAELKMLRTIHAATRQTTQTVVGTFLGAHAIDPDNPNYIEQTINETLPAVAAEFPDITVDAFCEQGAWSLEDTRRLFENARDMGCPLRVHTDQFNSLGMTRLAVEMGAVSVDHLEAITPKDLEHLARSKTIGVILPAAGFHLDGRYAPARSLIDAGGAVAIATNYNPGSAPTPSMPFIVALACRKLRLSPAEAITAATYNAACVLGLQYSVGSIEVGKRADLQLLDSSDERELAFEFATPGPLVVIVNGEVVHMRAVGREEN
ncbi:MAG: imidazolonepropionase [Phycisphaerales bacterium]|nr:imidazolonepropionase [Phycisphaerales bacterium]MCI0675352.1 imidazolonepropionase [Phycisphaerales bacterium]